MEENGIRETLSFTTIILIRRAPLPHGWDVDMSRLVTCQKIHISRCKCVRAPAFLYMYIFFLVDISMHYTTQK